jgi:hypothetical protein
MENACRFANSYAPFFFTLLWKNSWKYLEYDDVRTGSVEMLLGMGGFACATGHV